MSEPFWETHLIYRVVAGSRAYGLDTPASDTDTRGVCIPPAEVLLGLTPFEQWEDATRDNVVYALVKFARLALDCNPNILEALYVDPRHILHCDAYGEELRAHRALFLTRQAGQTFSGYAISQLRRLERHHHLTAGDAGWGAGGGVGGGLAVPAFAGDGANTGMIAFFAIYLYSCLSLWCRSFHLRKEYCHANRKSQSPVCFFVPHIDLAAAVVPRAISAGALGTRHTTGRDERSGSKCAVDDRRCAYTYPS